MNFDTVLVERTTSLINVSYFVFRMKKRRLAVKGLFISKG